MANMSCLVSIIPAIAASGLGGRQDCAPQPHGVRGRRVVRGGDIPKADPAGRDVYVMRTVLHDWPDTEAQQILANVRTAIGVLGTLDSMAEVCVCGLLIGFASRAARLQTSSLPHGPGHCSSAVQGSR